MDKAQIERLIGLIDLTRLEEEDLTREQQPISDLCKNADTSYGHVAAVCIYPCFIDLCRKELPDTNVKIATVVNFPFGADDALTVASQTKQAISYGADEIDTVINWRAILDMNIQAARQELMACKAQIPDGRKLKVILETAALMEHGGHGAVETAAKLAIECGADFVKTSTGKHPCGGASIEAAKIILQQIKKSGANIGIKISGGVRTKQQAQDYVTLASRIMGDDWVTPDTFRLGASSLLSNLISELNNEGEKIHVTARSHSY